MTTLDDLQAIIAEWSQRVVLQAIWFVDRPGEYYQMRAELQQAVPELFERKPSILATTGPNLAGIPVYEWRSFGASAKEWQTWPWIVLYPGVWLKWSDGTWARWRP